MSSSNFQTFKALIDRKTLHGTSEWYKKARVEWEVGFLCKIKIKNVLEKRVDFYSQLLQANHDF